MKFRGQPPSRLQRLDSHSDRTIDPRVPIETLCDRGTGLVTPDIFHLTYEQTDEAQLGAEFGRYLNSIHRERF